MSPLDPELRRELTDRFDAEQLPRLAQFLAAYLHEDWSLDYASPAEAVYDFLSGADLEEAEELAGEWSTLLALARDLPLDDLNRLIGERFGSPWRVTSVSEVEAVEQELVRALAE
ncbi:MAG: contact-dependent growth inhibition system immunity protein [Thermoanaerobaculia bacterium]